MTDSGKMIKLTVLAPTVTWMGHNTKVTGRRTSSMGTALRLGQMAPAMKETTWRGASMVKDASAGLTRALTRVNSKRTILKATVRSSYNQVRCLSTCHLYYGINDP